MAPIYEFSGEESKAIEVFKIGKRRYDLEKNQIADLDRSNWIVMPHEFTDGKYSLEMSPTRISNCPAVEKVGKELGINYKNTSKDSLGREFIGNNNWHEALKMDLALGVKAPSLEETTDYLRLLYLGSQGKIKVYDVSGKQIESKQCEKYLVDVVKAKNPWRAEWLDADFKTKGKELHINYHVFDKNGKIIQKSEVLDKNTLMKDKTPGISLENWIENPTKQGLPSNKTKLGNLYYWYPRDDNNSVARFSANTGRADLYCGRYPSFRVSGLGVRAAKQRE